MYLLDLQFISLIRLTTDERPVLLRLSLVTAVRYPKEPFEAFDFDALGMKSHARGLEKDVASTCC